MNHSELEKVNTILNDPEQLNEYKRPYDHYTPLTLPRILGSALVWCGNLVYGTEPSYLKFRSVEVIARVPYHSWTSATFALLTACYADEKKAIKLSKITEYARFAQDNETMHVVVISQLTNGERIGFIRHTCIPMLFAFFYFFASHILYLLRPRWSLELNYLFESHAYEQYDLFLKKHEAMLKNRPILCEYLSWYGRNPISQYEFFQSVRNDEIVHRNQSVHEIDFVEDQKRYNTLRTIGATLLIGALLVFLL